MGGKSTETQHGKSIEVSASVLERWLRMWAEFWHKQGLYSDGDLSVEIKERWAGSEEMMLNVFDAARDKIAEITYRVDKDRERRKFLAVKNQNTARKYRNRRLMTLIHFFLLHRYKADLVHYVRPTADNRLSVERMIHNGVFREARTDDPNMIAIEVDTARATEIFAGEESTSNLLRESWKCLEPIPTTLRFGRWQANRTSGPLPGRRARNSSITPQISAGVGTARFDRPFATHSFGRFETPSGPGYILTGIFACTENDNGLKDFGVFCGGIN